MQCAWRSHWSRGIALLVRCVSLVADGVSPTAFRPMIAEAVMIAVLIAGRRALQPSH